MLFSLNEHIEESSLKIPKAIYEFPQDYDVK
jgi:hypothetical protein